MNSEFEPTRAAGLQRLQHFAPRMGKDYAAGRNADEGQGARQNVSMLSPYLRFRSITEEEVLATVFNRFTLTSAEKFIQEVFWRAYFKGFLETRPVIWRNTLHAVAAQNKGNDYVRAVSGQTGIDCFDFWVKELKETGYLHNHARMWFASIWIFTLRLPWELGADFMYRNLVDGDPASNTLSWRWVGGLHTRGKTYLARSDNIAHYTNGRFHPKGLTVVAAPLEEAAPPAASALPAAISSMPEGRYGLLMTGEDSHVESLPCAVNPVAIATPSHITPKPGGDESPIAHQFRTLALKDATHRAEGHFQRKSTLIDFASPDQVIAWCQAESLTTVAVPYLAVGPEADATALIEAQLTKRGITLLRVRRRYDTLAWPHATKGFFALKEKLPALVQKLGLQSIQAEMF